jgi:hypothetical protein
MPEPISNIMKRDIVRRARQEEPLMISGEELNNRLDEQMMAIERVSILLEDAKLDPNDTLEMDVEGFGRLLSLLEEYEAFLDHFRDVTEDTVSAIRGLTTCRDSMCCGGEGDEDLDDDGLDDYAHYARH